MTELDAFERSLETAFRAFADRGVTPVDAAEFAELVAARPRRRRAWVAWLQPVGRLAAVPGVAWILLLAGLLIALVVGGLVVGTWRADETVITGETDILATTRAHPLPAQAVCPPGSDPDAPGPADQDRPSGAYDGAIAFDRHAGRLVLLEPDQRDPYGRAWLTWTYDVCTNTWQRTRLGPAEEPPVGDGLVRLVYDADSDRMLAFTDVNAFDFYVSGATTTNGEIWSYDLAADRWTKVGDYSWAGNAETHGTVFYHDPSGLVVAYDGTAMWAYDVDTNTLAKVRQRPDPSLPAEAGLPAGQIALGYDPGHDLVVSVVHPHEGAKFRTPYGRNPGPADTWTFRPGTGSWRKEAATADAQLIVCGDWLPGMTSSQLCLPTNGRAVFDEASGLTVFMANRAFTSSYVDAYDAGRDAWRTLADGEAGDSGCSSMPPAYDSLNGRIVCLSATPGSIPGVSTFSAATREWRWLLEESETLPPEPTPAPGATPIDWGTPPPGWDPPPSPVPVRSEAPSEAP